MPRKRVAAEIAAGRLISAIQKEWGKLLGTEQADEAEEVMNRAHELLQAASDGSLGELLKQKTTLEYLGKSWVSKYQSVLIAIRALEATKP